MDVLLQVLASGIMIGGLYGLISSGLALSFGITRVVNFAHGEFVTIGMYAAVLLAAPLGAAFLPVLPLVCIGVGLIGAGLFHGLLGRTAEGAAREEDSHMPQIVITVGLSVVLQGGLLAFFSAQERSVGGVLSGTVSAGVVVVPVAQLVAFCVAGVAFAGLHLVVRRTDFGRALRAVVDDADAAAMSGIEPRRVFARSFGIGIALACLSGGLLATYVPVTPVSGAAYLAIAFVTVVLGGLGSISGALVGGLLVGIVQQASATYVAPDVQNVFLWVAFVVILLARPSGLFGRRVAL